MGASQGLPMEMRFDLGGFRGEALFPAIRGHMVLSRLKFQRKLKEALVVTPCHKSRAHSQGSVLSGLRVSLDSQNRRVSIFSSKDGGVLLKRSARARPTNL